jgi:hypothetical protein
MDAVHDRVVACVDDRGEVFGRDRTIQSDHEFGAADTTCEGRHFHASVSLQAEG